MAQLKYNESTDRFELNGYGLHCGDCFEVLIWDSQKNEGEWVETSIESNWETGWYLTNKKLIGYQLEGLIARELK